MSKMLSQELKDKEIPEIWPIVQHLIFFLNFMITQGVFFSPQETVPFMV